MKQSTAKARRARKKDEVESTVLVSEASHAVTEVPELRTPEGWLRQLRIERPSRSLQRFEWQHAAAQAVHGWNLHAFHAGTAMMISRQDYEAALEAATQDDPRPHTKALSPHKN